MHPPIVMTFAATDPTGGAGLQADVLTLASLGCHPVSIATAITVQDTHGVREVHALETRWVLDQARALLDEMPVAAFKLGVLGSAQNAAAIAGLIAARRAPLVLDPVLASGRGDPLASDATIEALLAHLLPLTTVLTPNSVEARRLAGAAPDANLDDCAARLIARGVAHVLITGTHEKSAEVVNTLYAASGSRNSRQFRRLEGSYHGSGCTLASAIAAQLALGMPVPNAVNSAQDFTWRTLEAGFRPAAGQHIPDRFYWAHDARHRTGS
ncbi:MAG TPA: hydroxymethylpyrimidine/phosphomethylpyrimidine kinase [Burkholderiales bacterium]|nr:hydroxymethylpyrimidine/phosphomethylpyrimidine kinase [Burkholderiales bacterium]